MHLLVPTESYPFHQTCICMSQLQLHKVQGLLEEPLPGLISGVFSTVLCKGSISKSRSCPRVQNSYSLHQKPQHHCHSGLPCGKLSWESQSSWYLEYHRLYWSLVLWYTISAFYLPPVFEKRQEVLCWFPSPYPPSPPSPPSPRMFCLISRLLLKLAFWNLACAIYAKTILLKCF